MSLFYRHGQRYGLIPRDEGSNPVRLDRCKTTSDYEAMILTPEQSFAILLALPEPERTLALLAAGTGLRISECLGLQWGPQDPVRFGFHTFCHSLASFLVHSKTDVKTVQSLRCRHSPRNVKI